MDGTAVLATGMEERCICGEVRDVPSRERVGLVGPEDGRVVELSAGIELGQRSGLTEKRHTYMEGGGRRLEEGSCHHFSMKMSFGALPVSSHACSLLYKYSAG